MSEDWRLRNQAKYLTGVTLRWTKYRQYREGWDHDHCEFCFRTLSERKGDRNEGFATVDDYHWICRECYEDFKGMFSWTVVNPKEAPS